MRSVDINKCPCFGDGMVQSVQCLGDGLDDPGFECWQGSGFVSVLQNVPADPGANPASSSMCNGLLFRRLSGRNLKLSGEVKND
jgi:hypothetical protein